METPSNNCEHLFWKMVGLWDGKRLETGEDIAGPMAICKQCSKKQNFTWEDWNKIPRSNREGMYKRPDYKTF